MLKMQDGRPVIVSEPVMRPNVCAVSPQVFQDPEGFIDTGTRLPGFAPRVYLAIASVRELVRSMGWPTEAERDALSARVSELEAEVERLSGELAERDESLAAVAVLQRAGFRSPRTSEKSASTSKRKAAA